MTTIYELLEKEKFYFRMLELVKRAAYNTGAHCTNECLACDAKELLKEMEKTK